jgi:predicted Ser/Thr protein kinase
LRQTFSSTDDWNCAFQADFDNDLSGSQPFFDPTRHFCPRVVVWIADEAAACPTGQAPAADRELASQAGKHLSNSGYRTMRKRPALLRALGNDDPPEHVTVQGANYQIADILKHDSWAATAIYRNDARGRIICKFNRAAPVFGIPLAWAGRVLAGREVRFLRRLADVETIPNDLGDVSVEGRVLLNAIARDYVDGEPLRVKQKISPRVFEELQELLQTMHKREMAYVDLHKLENIILSGDGRPYLIDFQVCFDISARWPGNGRFARYCLAKLQEIDIYHLNKHLVRHLSETLTAEQIRQKSTIPPLIRIHRRIGAPLRTARRKLLVLIGVRDAGGSASSELEPEDSYRNVR